MTRTANLETIATAAAATVNIADETLRQRIADKIETEIDSTRPIQNGEHLMVIRTGKPINTGLSTVEFNTGNRPYNLENYIVAWGTAEELRFNLMKNLLDHLALTFKDGQSEEELLEEIKKTVAICGGFFGTFQA